MSHDVTANNLKDFFILVEITRHTIAPSVHVFDRHQNEILLRVLSYCIVQVMPARSEQPTLQ